MAGNELVLRAENLHKSYFMAGAELPVLKGIDLDIRRGQMTVVVGPSGVGKSTLLHILGALDRPTAGQVFLNNTVVFDMDDNELARFRNQTVGFVFQFHHLLPEFTALENVAMPRLILGKPLEEALEKARGLLLEMGLEHRLGHKPSELSGGEQQRVAVARALVNDPQIILADEPSGNLDVKSSEALHELLQTLAHGKNQTLVIATHNPALAKRADRVIELYDGRVKSDTDGSNAL